MRTGEEWIAPELARLRQKSRLRNIEQCPRAGGKFIDRAGRVILNFSSNDYLNFSQRPELLSVVRASLDKFGSGGGASRLMSGTLPIHERLEQETAVHKGYPAALTFGSGYLTNVGVISALVGRGDKVYADKLVHASILDGIQLSRARLVRFRHNDADHLRELLEKENKEKSSGSRVLVVTESVFSMDGDLAPLAELAEICTRYEAMLMVDEAHATGVFGKSGGGLIELHRVQDRVNVAMGTFSKALGNCGGFVACSAELRAWLVNRARSFIFTTSMPPPVAGGCLGALHLLRSEPEGGGELQRRAAWFRAESQRAGLNTAESQSQIIPIMTGSESRALSLARRLHETGILAVPVRPPTVPEGTSRLRFSLSLAHQEGDLEYTVERLCEAARAEGIGEQ